MIAPASTTGLWRRAGVATVVVAVGALVGFPLSLMENPLVALIVVGGLAAVAVMFVKIDWALYVLVFVVYLNLSDVAIEHYGAPSIAKLLFAVVLFLTVARWALRGEAPGGTAPAIAILAATGAVMALSLIYAGDPARTSDALFSFAKNAAITVTVTLIVVTVQTLRGVIWTVIGAGLLLGGLGTYQFLTGSFDSDFGGLSAAHVEEIVGAIDSWRLVGPIDDPNFYGQILVVLVPLAWDRLVHEPRRWLRPVAGAALVGCVMAIGFTYSRGALAALVVMLLAYVALHASVLLRRPVQVLALLAVIGAVAFAAPGRYLDRVTQMLSILPGQGGALSSNDAAIRGRFGEMQVAWQMFLDHPLLGLGVSNYETSFQRYNLRLGLAPRNEMREAHSLYLEIAAERGILGLAVFGTLVAMLAAAVTRARRRFAESGRQDGANLAGAIGFAWIGYAVTAIFLHDAYSRYFWLLVGITLALPQIAGREARSAAAAPSRGGGARRMAGTNIAVPS